MHNEAEHRHIKYATWQLAKGGGVHLYTDPRLLHEIRTDSLPSDIFLSVLQLRLYLTSLIDLPFP